MIDVFKSKFPAVVVTGSLVLLIVTACTESAAIIEPTPANSPTTTPTVQSTRTPLAPVSPAAVPQTTVTAIELPAPTEPPPTVSTTSPDPTSKPTATTQPTKVPLVAAATSASGSTSESASKPTPVPTMAPTIAVLPTQPATPIAPPGPTTEPTPPPFHYTSRAAAEAGAIELGCTGWGTVPLDFKIYYRACASAEIFAEMVANLGSDSDSGANTVAPTAESGSSTAPTSTPSPAPVELPPFHYLTDAEALAKADELGCTGTSGGVFEGISFRRACGSERDFQVIALKMPTTLSGDIYTLESDPTARFTTAPTDLSKIGSVVPPGSALSGTIKPHAYFHNKFVNDNSGKVRVPVYAVADSVLSAVDYYDSFLGIAEYLLFFDVTCEISFKYDHIAEVIPKIAALVPEVSPDSRGGVSGEGMSFKAGDLIGYAYGAGGSAAGGGGAWDFGAYDTTYVNQFVNQERYVQGGMSQSLHTVCPYDYFGDDLKNQMYALIGTSSQSVIPNAVCTTTERDVSGAAAGAWFEEQEISYSGAKFSIAAEPDNRISLSGIGGDLRPRTDNPTWFDPELLTTSHCYADSGRWIYLEVRAEGMQLAAASGTGSCPSAMPMEATIYYR